MNATTAPPSTIDFGPLMAVNAELAEVQDDLESRIDSGDSEAYRVASGILERQTAIIDELFAQFERLNTLELNHTSLSDEEFREAVFDVVWTLSADHCLTAACREYEAREA